MPEIERQQTLGKKCSSGPMPHLPSRRSRGAGGAVVTYAICIPSNDSLEPNIVELLVVNAF